jgi:hypothetical protein
MYFEAFPTIPYTNVKYGNTKTVTNLLKRVAVREVIRDNTVNFLKYQIKSGETPEALRLMSMMMLSYIGLFFFLITYLIVITNGL